MSGDQLSFRGEADGASTEPPWLVLIADDEEEVHAVTRLALKGTKFAGREVEFLHARSGQEARELLRTRPEIALVLLDVVMENEHAGLEVVQYVRNTLHNHFTRIVLRTGQPGQAPELDVITRYDINDYKHKTELTRDRLFTTVYTSLATYNDLIALDRNRRGLVKVIDASARIFEMHSLEYFAQGVLEQLTALLFLERDALVLRISGVAARGGAGALHVIAGTGAFQPLIGKDALQSLPPEILDRIQASKAQSGAQYGRDYFIDRQAGYGAGELVFYLGANRALNRPDSELIEKFCTNVAIAHRNLGKLSAARGRRTKDRAGS